MTSNYNNIDMYFCRPPSSPPAASPGLACDLETDEGDEEEEAAIEQNHHDYFFFLLPLQSTNRE
jgi:hypothetical protein